MADAKIKKKKHIFLLLRVAVVAAGLAWAVVWLCREQRWQNLTDVFHQMNIWLFAAALALFMVSQIIVGFRWWLLLRTQSVFIKFVASVKLHFLGLFYNNFLPSSVGGDLIRAWYVTKHTENKFQAALSVFVDRAIGLASTLSIAVFFYWLFLSNQDCGLAALGNYKDVLKLAAEYKLVIFSFIAVLAVIFCALFLHSTSRAMLKRTWSYFAARLLTIIGKAKSAAVFYFRRPLTILAVFALTVFLQLIVITGFWLLGSNMGIEAGIKYYLVFFPMTWVLGALPVSVGGAVVVEGGLVTLFTHFAGVSVEKALAIALCQRLVWMLASLPGAIIHLFGAHLPKDFSVDYNEPII